MAVCRVRAGASVFPFGPARQGGQVSITSEHSGFLTSAGKESLLQGAVEARGVDSPGAGAGRIAGEGGTFRCCLANHPAAGPRLGGKGTAAGNRERSRHDRFEQDKGPGCGVRVPPTCRPNTIGWTQISAIVTGHILGLLAAHDHALALVDSRRQAIRSQIPIAILMIGITSTGVLLLISV